MHFVISVDLVWHLFAVFKVEGFFFGYSSSISIQGSSLILSNAK
jgi:hypothetical protein